ncbi:hypothetical protein [Geotoga petraea]|uniref:Uncharacterized protein n=1 Tax=Geotoga petraea TaxID=28234 RepID=A0A4Z0W5S7_9BACT|nr:hypothetical protein [Geotoga petraea]TGG88685.1 hypothetical protein E4650_00325 [Geotoga petraea]
MKKSLLISFSLLFILIGVSAELSRGEQRSREIFSESLELLFSEQKYEARLKLDEAMSGEVYIEDIPKFWYYAAKLDTQLGRLDRAREDLQNIFLFSGINQEAETLQKFIASLEEFSVSNFSTPTFYEIETQKNIVDSFEKYYTINDSIVFNSNIYTLDSQNKIIYKKSNEEEKWIRLPQNQKFYNMSKDKNLNRIYISSDKGIYFINSYSKNITMETESSTPSELDPNIENIVKPLIVDYNLFILDTDKIGRIYAYDPENSNIKVIGYDGTILNEISIPLTSIITAGTVLNNTLYTYDLKTNKIQKYDILKEKFEDELILPENIKPISISVLPWNKPIISTYDGFYELNLETKSYKSFSFDSVDEEFQGLFKVDNGLGIFSDYKNYSVKINRLYHNNIENLYTLNLYGLNFDVETYSVNAKIEITDIHGIKIDMINKNLSVVDSGGRVPFNILKRYSIPNIESYENLEEFMNYGVAQSETDSFIIIEGYSDVDIGPEEIAPIILSSNRLFFITDELEVDDRIKNFINASGGLTISRKYSDYLKRYVSNSYKPIDFISYKLTPPIISGIKQTSVNYNLPEKILTDSLYYYTEGVGSGE